MDHVFTTRLVHALPKLVQLLYLLGLTWIVRGMSSRFGILPHHLTPHNLRLTHHRVRIGLKQDFPLKRSHPTANQEILLRICSQHIKVKPNIKKIKKNSVVFDDDTEVDADVR